MSSKRRRVRSHPEIVRDLLEALKKEPLLKTNIMYAGNLSWGRTNRYLSLLKDKGLIVTKLENYGTPFYHLTPKGRDLLTSLNNVLTILKE